MANFAIKPKAFYDSFQDVQPSQPYVFEYADRPEFTFSFLPNEIQVGDVLVFAVDNDMVFYDSTPELIIHSAPCMVVVKHTVTSEDVANGSVTMQIETRTVKFRDAVNGKVRPIDVVAGLYRKRGVDENTNYTLMAKGRALANGIIADYDTLPEPITTDDYYTKDDIDGMMAQKADESDLTSHTSDTDVHVTVADKTAWDSKADLNDIPTNVSELTNDSDYQTGTDVETAISTAIADKADKATTLAGYGITDAYTKTEVDSKVASVYRYKGTVQTYADLPATGQEVGDVYNVVTADTTHGIKAGDNVAWTGTAWDVLAGEIDLSAYATKTELATKLDEPAVAGTVGQVLTKTATGQEWADTVAGDIPDYLCFTAERSNAGIQFNAQNNPTHPFVLEYSTDGRNWNPYTTGTAIFVQNIGDKVYFRGDNNTDTNHWEDNTNKYYNFAGFGFACSGNVMSIFDKTVQRTTFPGDGVGISSLFKGSLITTPPKLPAKALVAYCYGNLFENCTALRKAPELPAMTLANADGCYQYMFKGCTSLAKAPELPANVLANNCYKYMFQGCTALKEAPYLPAIVLTTECYANMFDGCSSLSEIPTKLPATTLAEKCYSSMFNGCSMLRKPPVLPATTMATRCYSDMFGWCGLTEVPELPALDLAEYCYSGMFKNNVKLEKIPLDYLPATTLQTRCYNWMFKGCTSLKVGCRLPATVMTEGCYSNMYDSCTSLVDSERIDATTLANICMNQMFKGCTSLTRLWIPNMTAFDESATPAWMSGLSNLKRAFVCNANLDTSVRNESRIPEGWIPTRRAYAGDAMVNMWNMNDVGNFTFAPTNSEQNMIYLWNNTTLTLNAISLPSNCVGSAQVLIYWGASITATIIVGEGIDFVDTPRKGYLSRVLITWDGTGNAKLRVMWETAL